MPLAYFITFTVYGAWLHGRDVGSVDKDHNEPGTPFLPEKAMSDFKAYASRRLKERLGEPADCKRWTQHGSTRYLWTEDSMAKAVEYAVDAQGERMAVFDGRDGGLVDASQKAEPEAGAKDAAVLR